MSLNDNVLPPPNHHDFDTFMGNNFVDYTSSYNPEHTLPSPLSPLTMVCNDGRRHDDHMNFASTFSVHPASSKCAIQHYGNSNQELTKGYQTQTLWFIIQLIIASTTTATATTTNIPCMNIKILE